MYIFVYMLCPLQLICGTMHELFVYICAFVYMCVRACVCCACVRVCVRASARALIGNLGFNILDAGINKDPGISWNQDQKRTRTFIK